MTKEKVFKSLKQHEREEPQEYERQYMSAEDEKAFEEWTKRLVPAVEQRPF